MIKKGIPILISSKDLLDYVSQEDIATRYISGFSKIGDSFKSEFRTEKLPSSRVFYGKHGDLMFKDFGDPNFKKAISIIQYVQYKYDLKYQAAINKIGIDFGLIKGDDISCSIVKSKRKKIKREYKAPSNLVIRIRKRDWSEYDKEYWGSYYIPTTLLERNQIYPISHVFYGSYPPTEYSSNHLIYSYDYYWSNGIFRRKIYQPKSLTEKWRTNTDYTVVQNYPNIPKDGGDLLFIQSSYKDCMVMEQLGYYSVAPNNEGSWIPKYYWDKLKDRWNKLVIFWDNDWEKDENSGLIMAQNYGKEYNIPYITTPDIKGITDISDYVRMYGIDKGKELVKELI